MAKSSAYFVSASGGLAAVASGSCCDPRTMALRTTATRPNAAIVRLPSALRPVGSLRGRSAEFLVLAHPYRSPSQLTARAFNQAAVKRRSLTDSRSITMG